MSSNSFLIVGLGNPGDKYAGTRHNVGFLVVDELARVAGVELSSLKWDAMIAKVSLWGATLHLIKPQTFMNRSGKAVSKFVDFFKIEKKRMLVIHDDLDMNTARLKLVFGGGAGGHNGIRSIVASMGDKDFYRLKIGIGRPGNAQSHADMPVDRYVLTPFHGDELEQINGRMNEVLAGLQKFIETEPAQAMNYLNSFR